MKKIFVPVFVSLCLLSACKEEKAPANMQEGTLAPLTSESYTPPAPTPADTSGDGYIDTTRYSIDEVNEYQFADSLLGPWRGVEGASLDIKRDPNGKEYFVTVTNLDGPRAFPAKAVKGGLEFERDGKTETIRSGDGIDTGMKYLIDKLDCVVITKGAEGFCRD